MQENLTNESRVPMSVDKKCDTVNIAKGLWLSYIIPLYNCGDYIATCLDSVLLQGLEPDEYEVIVINDGSTDNGAEIVSQYCQEHDNFRLINKENGGVSSARNRGIDEACGEYIYFMDADDYLLPKGMKILRDDYLKKYGHADVISFWCHTVDKHYDKQEWERIRPHKAYFQGNLLEYGNNYGIGGFVYVQIISKEFIISQNIHFPSYVIHEDVMFMLSLFSNTNATITATSLDIYRYCVRENSAITGVNTTHTKRVYKGNIEAVKEIRKIQKSSPYNKIVFDNWIQHFQRTAFTRLCSSSLSYHSIQDLLREAIQADFFPVKEAKSPIAKFINKVYDKPLLVYLFSLPYRHIFIPYIKPYVRRN